MDNKIKERQWIIFLFLRELRKAFKPSIKRRNKVLFWRNQMKTK